MLAMVHLKQLMVVVQLVQVLVVLVLQTQEEAVAVDTMQMVFMVAEVVQES